MSRYISFVMLVATIFVCGFFFYNVIKGFILPLFIAALMAVIFRPVHEWVRSRVDGKPTLAAAISTTAIMLIVTLPLAGMIALGVYEANQVVRSKDKYIAKLKALRMDMGLQKPFADPLDEIDKQLQLLEDTFNQSLDQDRLFYDEAINKAREIIDTQLVLLTVEARDAAAILASEEGDTNDESIQKQALMLRDTMSQALAARNSNLPDAKKAGVPSVVEADYKKSRGPMFAEQQSLKYVLLHSNGGDDARADDTEKKKFGKLQQLASFESKLLAIPISQAEEAGRPVTVLDQHKAFQNAQLEYDALRTYLFGGPIWRWGTEIVDPSDDQVDEWISKLFTVDATRWLPSITNTATSLVSGLLMGLAIIAIALFYFFMDGPKMITAFMHLSPLDDRHEIELLQEFDKVSRAVVVATLLSAVMQGILGGIGYKLVGLDSVWLLTLLTAVLALIPFIGAAAVWAPCCVYIAFLKETPEEARTWMYARAGFLAVYGVLIISMADNVIKPWVLQGQSKLHPLLALLSVLGGVQALGPIGILVGPMVVAFLQVLLTILQREIISLDEEIHSAGT